jgi:hypothetical protein
MTISEGVSIGLGFLAIVAPDFWPKMPRPLSYLLAATGLAWLTYSGILAAEETSGMSLRHGPLALIVLGAICIAGGLFWHIGRLGAQDAPAPQNARSATSDARTATMNDQKKPSPPPGHEIPSGFGAFIDESSQFTIKDSHFEGPNGGLGIKRSHGFEIEGTESITTPRADNQRQKITISRPGGDYTWMSQEQLIKQASELAADLRLLNEQKMSAKDRHDVFKSKYFEAANSTIREMIWRTRSKLSVDGPELDSGATLIIKGESKGDRPLAAGAVFLETVIERFRTAMARN